jgi:hypothetical protein
MCKNLVYEYLSHIELLIHSRKQIYTTKSNNPIGLKKIFKLIHVTLYMLNIGNNDPFLTFPLVL